MELTLKEYRGEVGRGNNGHYIHTYSQDLARRILQQENPNRVVRVESEPFKHQLPSFLSPEMPLGPQHTEIRIGETGTYLTQTVMDDNTITTLKVTVTRLQDVEKFIHFRILKVASFCHEVELV